MSEQDLVQEAREFLARIPPIEMVNQHAPVFIHALCDEVERLRNALLPFALLDIRHLSERPDSEPIWAINKSQITNGHIRNAQRLIQEAVDGRTSNAK